MKHSPRILKVYEPFPRVSNYPLQEFKLRIVKYENSERLLDIREFVSVEGFAHYSRKGVSLTLPQVIHLFTRLADIISVMNVREENVRSKEIQPIQQEIESNT